MTAAEQLIHNIANYSAITPEAIAPQIDNLLETSKAKVAEVLTQPASSASWKTLEKLEEISHNFEAVWSPIRHLNSVASNDEYQAAYDSALAKVTEFHTDLAQNPQLFALLKELETSTEFAELSAEQQKVIELKLRDFKLSGIDLPQDKQARFKEVSQELSQLSSQFGHRVLQATAAWDKPITDKALLDGLPESAMNLLKQYAQNKDLDGWRITLDFPSYLMVQTHANNRELREEVYKAYVTKASELAEKTEFNTSDLISEILELRYERAQLLGFANFAELSLATKMAPSTEEVIKFLRELGAKAKQPAQAELDELRAFAKAELGLEKLEPWDMMFASEKYKQQKFNLSQEELRPYFPLSRVLDGMFEICRQIFGIEVKEVTGAPSWHKDVTFYQVYDAKQKLIAGFYLDPYAREGKRSGAWMSSVYSRWQTAETNQLPLAYLVCNFTPPVAGKPACLTHEEVTTLFHEFGHGLHHILTQQTHLDVAGINNVPWDAVELPSQFMENFCWQEEGINLISQHLETNTPLPAELLNSLRETKTFQAAMQLVRQLEFALFDFRLHAEYQPENPQDIYQLLDEVRQEVAVVIPPSYNRFANSFSHIFAGGYAAGYYSYKWAEVLAADAFEAFLEAGVLSPEVGASFKENILEKGGSEDPQVLYKNFRGKEASIDALLKDAGIL